jgi:signal transduction histidine kinase
LVDTFNALLAIARMEAGRPEGEPEVFDLSAAVADVVELYAPVAEERGSALHTDVSAGIRIKGFRQLASQALANLVDNALKYTAVGGNVNVSLKKTERGAELIVADNGPGIPVADRERVLDRFVRLEASRNSPGSGLGLSLVRAVARLHCAELVLEDNLPGLRVVLRFPSDAIVGNA